LDEPTIGVDPAARRETWTAIENLTAAGMTVPMTKHYFDEAEHLADRIVVVADGHVVADSSPSDLRATTGGSTIRHLLPAAVHPSEVPDQLAPFLQPDRRTLVIRSEDQWAMLETLIAWARARQRPPSAGGPVQVAMRKRPVRPGSSRAA
jgi:ABC-type multidrug transport system ATPase subunit